MTHPVGLQGSLDEQSLIGCVLGNYRLTGRIGGGAYGEVYRAEHIHLGTPYAAKILHPAFALQETALKRFWREAQTTSRLQHENIVAVMDFNTDPQLGPYLIMEYLEGRTLGEVLQAEGALPLLRVREIAKPICLALNAAHEHGVIHRDLKPDNVFLISRKEGELVKILDFGIARLTDGGEALTGAGQTIGTPEYMSPEQCRGQQPQPQTDIYCFGVLLYQMLTGELPFQGTEPHQFMMHHLLTPPPPLGPDFSDELQAFVASLLEKEPDARPASMTEVWAQLTLLLPRQKVPTFSEQKGVDAMWIEGADDGAYKDDEQTQNSLKNTAEAAPAHPMPALEPTSPAPEEDDDDVILLVKKSQVSPTMEMNLALSEQEPIHEDPGTMIELSAVGERTPFELPAVSLAQDDQLTYREESREPAYQGPQVWRTSMFVIQLDTAEDFVRRDFPQIQAGEFFVFTQEPALLGDEIFVRFVFPDQKKLAEGRAHVVNVVLPGSQAHAGMAIQFSELELEPCVVELFEQQARST